jgi:hypothetical protein
MKAQLLQYLTVVARMSRRDYSAITQTVERTSYETANREKGASDNQTRNP